MTAKGVDSAAVNDASAALERYRETRRVTLVGAVLDLVLGVAKIVVGFFNHSQALVADGVHSLSDLGTDVMVLVAAKHASAEADEEHPYGHARIETVATVALGAALLLVAIGLAYDAISRLFEPARLLTPGWLSLVVASISIFSKEAIYHYTMRSARKLRSNMLRANAWHSRSDAISSIVVVIGVAGTMAGLNYLDALAAVGVALMLAKIGWGLGWHSVRELVDTGLDRGQVEQIRDTIESVTGVRDLHLLRTRRMGGDALVDVHIQVDPKLSVSEGHQVSEAVRWRLIRDIDEVSDVTVHIDPENDEAAQSCRDLPLRRELMAKLEGAWSDVPAAAGIEKVTMHYLSGRVHLEVLLPLQDTGSVEAARDQARELEQAARRLPEVGNVQVNYH